jgi:hypothetical protein
MALAAVIAPVRDKSAAPGAAVRIVLQGIRRGGLPATPKTRASSRWAKLPEDDHMHASLAFVNGAGSADKDLRVLNTLLSTAGADQRKSVERGKSKVRRQSEEESIADTASKRGGFKNDPDDPTNPNQVRERSLKKIRR